MSRTPRSDASFERLRALRDSGYCGPVDQDGHAVTSGESLEVLRELGRVVVERPGSGEQ